MTKLALGVAAGNHRVDDRNRTGIRDLARRCPTVGRRPQNERESSTRDPAGPEWTAGFEPASATWDAATLPLGYDHELLSYDHENETECGRPDSNRHQRLGTPLPYPWATTADESRQKACGGDRGTRTPHSGCKPGALPLSYGPKKESIRESTLARGAPRGSPGARRSG
jgi:hypothetical protein